MKDNKPARRAHTPLAAIDPRSQVTAHMAGRVRDIPGGRTIKPTFDSAL